MKKYLFFLIFLVLLAACGDTEKTTKPEKSKEITEEKHEKMLDSGVDLYLNQMTMNYSNAFTISVTKEDKMKYLNDAITDINTAVYEIEDEYEEGVPPTNELFQLAEALLDSIEYEMIGESEKAGNRARDAGALTRQLSDEYLGGKLPIGIQLMIDNTK